MPALISCRSSERSRTMLRVGAHVGGGRRVARERAEIGQAAGVLQLARALELLGDGDDVAGLAVRRRARAMASKISRWSGR